MTLGEAKEKTLKILDELENSTSALDYQQKFNSFFDMGQREIARVKQIIHIFPLENQKAEGDWCFYDMPEDFREFIGIVSKTSSDFKNYRWLGRTLLIPKGEEAGLIVQYFAYPAKIDDNTEDTYSFDIDEEAQEALPFYVAAQCVIKEYDLRYYDNYMAKYQNILANFGSSFLQNGGGVETVYRQ